MHIAVPLGIKLLLDALEDNATVARAFTRRLRAIFYAGAGIDPSLWQRLHRFRDACGTFEILSGYGATEAASTICLSPAPIERPGELGHPLPGHDVALVETDGRCEMRVRGPNIAPGYMTEGGLSPLPLDEQGFYRTGDGALLKKRDDGQPVFVFDGRLAEDFKLASGTKVRAHWLRGSLIAHCAPLVDDIIVAGENRKSLVALVFPAAGHRGDGALLERLSNSLAAWNASNASSSTTIARFAVASIAPDRARGEVSDKGEIVRSRFLRNHADLFDDLYGGKGLTPTIDKAS
jgi:feruloyl-CoA synthase